MTGVHAAGSGFQAIQAELRNDGVSSCWRKLGIESKPLTATAQTLYDELLGYRAELYVQRPACLGRHTVYRALQIVWWQLGTTTNRLCCGPC